MSDPFASDRNASPITLETKVGLGVVLIVVTTVSICAWSKYSSLHSDIPLHIQNAPIARHVGPDHYLKPIEDSQRALDAIANSARKIAESQDQRRKVPPIAQSEVDSQRLPPKAPTYGKMATTESEAAKVAAVPRKLNVEPRLAVNLAPQQPTAAPTSRDLSDDYILPKAVSALGKKESGTFAPLPIHEKELVGKNAENSGESQAGTSVSAANSFADESEKAIAKVGYNQAVETNDFMPLKSPSAKSKDESRSFDTELQPPARRANDFANDENISLEVIDPPAMENAVQATHEPFKMTGVERNADQKNLKPGHISHVVAEGDSFWTISQKYYDDGRFFRALYEFNQSSVGGFDDLQPGIAVKVPPLEELQSGTEKNTLANEENKDTVPGNSYRTNAGDTLFNIAREMTGQASNYLELIRLNRSELPADVTHLTRLQAGLSLQLPKR